MRWFLPLSLLVYSVRETAVQVFFGVQGMSNSPFATDCKSQHSAGGFCIDLLMGECADYTILWPFPTESLTAQKKSGEPSLQASLRSLVMRKLLSVKFRCFSCSYGSTGQFADVAKLSVGCGQTFG